MSYRSGIVDRRTVFPVSLPAPFLSLDNQGFFLISAGYPTRFTINVVINLGWDTHASS